MSTSNLITRNRATLKLLFVGALSMVMLIPLLMVIAGLMYLTRNVDWYNYGNSE